MNHIGLVVAALFLVLAGGVPAAAADPSPRGSEGGLRGQAGEVLFLGNRNLAPVFFEGAAGPDGIAADIVAALGRHMRGPVRVLAVDWGAAQRIVAAGGADVLVQINRTPEREQIYDFSEPLLESHFSIFVRSGQTGIRDLAGLTGMRVGVEAAGLPAQLIAASAPGAIVVPIPDFATGFRQLSAGAVDAVVVDHRVGTYTLAAAGVTGIGITGEAIAPSWSAFAVAKGNSALLAEINAALGAIRADGTYGRIVESWAPVEGVFETRAQIDARNATIAIGGLLALLVASVAWAWFAWVQIRRARRAEEDVRGIFATTSAALDAAPDSIGLYRAVWDADGHFADAEVLFVNRTGRRRWFNDEAIEALRGSRLFETRPHLRPLVFELYRRAAEGAAPIRQATEYDTVDGRRVIDVTVTPFQGGFVHVGRDITDERQAQDALRSSEAELRRTVEGVEAIISYRAGGSDQPTLSGQVERLLGYRPEDVAPYAAWEELIHPDDLERCRAAWAPGPRQWDLEYRVRHVDGHWVWLSDRGSRSLEPGGLADHGVLTDITAAHRSAERFRAIMDTAADAILTIDSSGRVVEANPSATRVFRLPHDELVGKPLAMFMPEGPRQAHLRLFGELAQGQLAGLPEGPLLVQAMRADGTPFPAEVSLAAWGSAEDRHVTAFVRDVTDRVRARRELEVADARLRHLVDANLFGTAVADPDGRVVEANDRWLALTGWTRDDLEAGIADWRTVTAPESLAADERAIAEVHERGRSAPYEKDYARRGGARVPVLAVWTEQPGGGSSLVSVVLDMSEVQDATNRLARLGAAIEQTSESVVVADLEGTITYVNPAFERISGFSLAEAVGQNPRILKSGAQGPAFYEAMWATLASGETWTGELVNQRKDGSRYVELATISPVRGPSGVTEAYVAVKRDITAEREQQALRQRGQRLEALGQLAGGVAHDFNNILTAIRGYGDFIREELPEGSAAADDMDSLLRAADRASGLTRQLLVFSRRQPVVPQVIDPAVVIAEAIGLLRRLIGEHVTLETHLETRFGHVLADPGQLEQAVVNLAVNARDAMPGGGVLRIGVSEAPALDGTDAVVRIVVADTGCGMDEATAARAFEPFFTTKHAGQGTGLGLAMVAAFVQGGGGSINLVSSPGGGTTVQIDLPLVAAPDIPGSRAPVDIPGGTEHLLVVEDEPMAREVVRRYLAGAGYRVEVAGAAQEAIEVLASVDDIDLLVSDVRLPGMQGPELARAARQIRPDLPVIFMSAFADVFDSGDGEIDRSAVLDKPFTRESLAQAVRRALDMM